MNFYDSFWSFPTKNTDIIKMILFGLSKVSDGMVEIKVSNEHKVKVWFWDEYLGVSSHGLIVRVTEFRPGMNNSIDLFNENGYVGTIPLNVIGVKK